MSKKVKISLTIVIAAVLAAAAVGVWFALRGADEKPSDPVAARMQDEAYLAKLDKQDQDRRAIMKRMTQARNAYKAAEAAGASESELAALKAEIVKGAQALEANRLQSQYIVRDRILADQAAAEQLQKKGK